MGASDGDLAWTLSAFSDTWEERFALILGLPGAGLEPARSRLPRDFLSPLVAVLSDWNCSDFTPPANVMCKKLCNRAGQSAEKGEL